MRLAELGLIAYGPFSECLLDFSAGSPGGLHLIYGANEAGKSTALRAVSGLFFGIPERTQDAHLHPAQELRVSGVLEDGEGRALRIIRRKKRKAPLRDANDEPLDEAVLKRWLGGVDRELFRGLFGLDHHALKLGGEALLAGKGDVGESLYDAGMGGRSIHAVLSELKGEAEELFKARGENPRLNVALKAYKESLLRRNDAGLTPKAYFDQREQLEAGRARRVELETERKHLHRERDRLLRIASVLKPAARRRELLEQRARLGPVRPVPEGTTAAREEAEGIVAECTREIERLERSIAKRREQLEHSTINQALLGIEPELAEELGQRLALIHKVEGEVPALRAAIAAREDEARAILQRLGRAPLLDEISRLRPSLADEGRIRELERERALHVERVEAARERQSVAEAALAVKRLELSRCAEPASVSSLQNLVQRAHQRAHLEARERKLEAERARAEAESRAKYAALGLADALAAPLLEALVPDLDLVEQFATDARESADALRRARTEHEQHTARVRQVTRQITRIQQRGSLPAAEALEQARRHRDELWLEVKRLLRGESADSVGITGTQPSGAPLPEAFEAAEKHADALADARLREAARVAELQTLSAQFDEQRELAGDAERALAGAERAQAALEERWQALWRCTPLPAPSPLEARVWLTKLLAWRARSLEERTLEHELAECRREIEATCCELCLALGAPPAPLALLLDRADAKLREELAWIEQRKLLAGSVLELEVRLQQAQVELGRHEGELQRWQHEWQGATAGLALGHEPTPGLVIAFLDELRELFRKLDELPEKRRRLQTLLADQLAFSERVTALVQQYAPELAPLPCERAAEQLLRAVNDAETGARERQRLLAEIGEDEREREEYLERMGGAERTLRELLQKSQASDVSELIELERRARTAAELDARIAGEEERMRELGEGSTLPALLAECDGIERAQVMSDKEDVEARLLETEEQLSNTKFSIKELENGLTLLRTDEASAEAAQESEILASDVRELVARYARVRLAGVILEREIARYRDRHQGPVLSRAAALFPRLTLGRYKGLRVGLEQQVILCVRDDGKEVEVSGLSEGAQYQLYLALRLATIERYLASHPALPLVLDDVLLHFDDQRSRAAFEVLGELAQRMQVLFFTHHARHVELAREVLGEGRAFVHELSAWSGVDLERRGRKSATVAPLR